MKYKFRVIVGLMAGLGAFLAVSGQASAYVNENINLTGERGIALSPLRLSADITPGQTVSGEFRVRSTGSRTQNVFAEITPYSVLGEDYGADFNTVTPRNEIIRWTTLGIDSEKSGDGCQITSRDTGKNRIYFTLRSKEECYVKYEIAVPKNAPSGMQYAGFFVQNVAEGDDELDGGAGVLSQHRIGLVLHAANRSGGEDECGEIIRRQVPFWVFSGPIETNYTVKNCGGLDFYVDERMEVRNLFGKLVYKSEYGKAETVVMADTTRFIKKPSWDEPGIGVYRVRQVVKMFGKEYAVEEWSICIPFWLLIAILIAIVVFVLALVFGVKKSKQKRKNMRKFGR
jgi:hypothetical protein